MGWRSGRSLSTTAIPTVGALSISSCAGAKRNETWRVCELHWSVAPNLSRPHLFSPETKIWSATTRVLRASIFTPPFSSAANPPLFAIVSSFLLFVYKPRHVIISRRYPLIKLLSLIFLVPTRFSGGSLSTPRCISLPLCPLQRLLLSLNLDWTYTRDFGSELTCRRRLTFVCRLLSEKRFLWTRPSTATLCRRTFDAPRYAWIPFDKRIREATKVFFPRFFFYSPAFSSLFPRSVRHALFAPVRFFPSAVRSRFLFLFLFSIFALATRSRFGRSYAPEAKESRRDQVIRWYIYRDI